MKTSWFYGGLLAALLPSLSLAATFTVTNTWSGDPGSLADAIRAANANPGPDVIRFDIQPPGPHIIGMSDPFSTITDPLTIDGTTQPGFAGVPLIEINSGWGWWSGLVVASSNCAIRGLSIVNAGNSGIHLEAGANGAVIGGTNGAGNRIAFNGGNGVTVADGTNHSIRGNSIFANGGLGIDLGWDDVTDNDNDDPDDGVNGLQNFPLISSATISASGIALSGSLNSRRQTTFQLDFYASQHCDDSGHGEGQSYLGSASITTGNGGNRSFNVTLTTTVLSRYITVTATDPADNTSEFSPCVRAGSSIAPATFTVTNTLDSGPGSLRQAILSANARLASGPNTIAFNIPGAGVKTILPQTELPEITGPVVLDGYTQPGASVNTQSNAFNAVVRVRLDGLSLANFEVGLTLTGGGSTVRGLMVVNFPNAGIRLEAEGNNVVSGNLIGLDASGLPQANGWLAGNSGVLLFGTTNSMVGGAAPAARNIISGNAGAGVVLTYSPKCSLLGNFMGSDATGTYPVPNQAGIAIDSSPNALVGGATSGARNLISGNALMGIVVEGGADDCRVEGNIIGADVTGILPLGNETGVIAGGAAAIGGTDAGAGNVIAFNRSHGVAVFSQHIAVRRNAIFENGGLGIDFGGDGPTPNDGTNLQPDFPEMVTAVNYPTRTILRGSLDSTPDTLYAIEFFDSPACDDSGYGEGRTYLGATNATTDASGHANFSWTAPALLAVGHVVTATATDPYGNTSEFSACAPVVPYDSADLRVEAGVSGDPVSLSSNFTYTVTVRNFGPTNATGVLLSNVLPANVTFVSAAPSQGSCAHAAGSVTCALGPLAQGGSAMVTLVVHPVLGGAAELASSVRATQADPLSENNALVLSQPAVGISDLAVHWIADPPVLPAGVAGTMLLVISNAGPDLATDVFVNLGVPSHSWHLLSAETDQGPVRLNLYTAEAWLDPLPPFQAATVSVRIIVLQGGGSASGMASSQNSDPDFYNNGAEASPTFVAGPGGLMLEAPAFVAAESTGQVIVRVQRAGETTGTVSVAYATDAGSATPGVDYTAVSGTLTFGDGESVAEFAVPVTDDFDADCNETFSVRLFNATGGAILLPGGSNAVVTIGDNDLRLTGLVQGVSVTRSNAAFTGNGPSFAPVISEDGRHAAFVSHATDLVPGVTQLGQVYVRDLDTGLTTLASVNRDGTDGGGAGSQEPSFSRDGRFLVFTSSSLDLVPDGQVTNSVTLGQNNVYRRDLVAGVTELISVNRADGGLANNECQGPSSSSNGALVVFRSYATDLVSQRMNGGAQLFARDIAAGVTRLVSVNRFGVQSGNGSVWFHTLSADGRYVAFSSDSSDLVPNDNNSASDVFVRDLLLGSTTLISTGLAGGVANSWSDYPILTPDGRHLVFCSHASDLVPGTDTNDATDVFLRDLVNGVTRLVSVNSAGTAAGHGDSFTPIGRAVSEDGCHVIFDSSAADLVPTDTNGEYDVFVRDMTLGHTRLMNTRCAGADSSLGGGGSIGLSADGRYALFLAHSLEAAPGDHQFPILLRRDVTGSSLDLININLQLTGGAAGCNDAALSGDGRTVIFQGNEDTVLAGDTNASADLFVWKPLPPGTVDLTLSLTDAPDPAPAGSNVTYTITIANRGPNVATNIVLTDTLPAGATFLAASPSQGGCSNLGAIVTCHLGSLNVGPPATVQITARLAESGLFTNTATVVAAQPDPLAANNSATERTTRMGRADLALRVTALADPVLLGQIARFVITVTNHGPDKASGVRVASSISAGASFSTATPSQGTVAEEGPALVWQAGTLAPNTGAQLTVETAPFLVGSHTLGATGASSDVDANLANNAASATIASVSDLGRLSFSPASYPAEEGAGPVFLTVIRRGETGATVSVSYSTGPDSALVGADFTPVSGTLVFTSGETVKTFTVPIVDDGLAECAERFEVSLSNPAGGAVLGDGPALAEVLIADNDAGPPGYLLGVSVTATNPAATGNGQTGLFSSQSQPSLSDDGRYVAFASLAANLTPGDGPRLDLFVRDLWKVQTVLVSPDALNLPNGSVSSGALSGDGRFVVYSLLGQLQVRDWRTGVTRVASVRPDGRPGNDRSDESAISRNGQVVAFSSRATDLVPLADTNLGSDIFAWDATSGTVRLVSVNRLGTGAGNRISQVPILSANGRFVAFVSGASDLVTNDTNGLQDVFVRYLVAGTTVLASINLAGTSGGNGYSYDPVLSADGRYVAFTSRAGDLTPGDGNGAEDVFVRDLVAGTTRLVSVNATGTGSGNAGSLWPSISADGRSVAFQSYASDLTPMDTNPGYDVFVRDLIVGTTTLASVRCDGTAGGNNYSRHPTISANGRYVGFTSVAMDLTSDAVAPGAENVFRRDLLTGQTLLCSRGLPAGGSSPFSQPPGLSADGSTVAFLSQASNLLPLDGNGQQDLFAWVTGPLPLALSAVQSGGTVFVTWLQPGTPCTLLTTTDPTAPASWAPVAGGITEFGIVKVHATRMTPGEQTRYYRLRCL